MTPEDRAQALWMLLDDIDTAYDTFSMLCEPQCLTKLELYISTVAKKRFEYYSSNGYNLQEVAQ